MTAEIQCSGRTKRRGCPQCKRGATVEHDGYPYCRTHVRRWLHQADGSRAREEASGKILSAAAERYMTDQEFLADKVFPKTLYSEE